MQFQDVFTNLFIVFAINFLDKNKMKTFKIILLFLCAFLIPSICVFYIHERTKKENYLRSDPKLLNILEKFEKFFKKDTYWSHPLTKLNDNDLMNNITFYRGNKSYTINKEIVYICLKDEKGEYYNENMLIYVIAHEIAHVLCDEIGHTDAFFEIFDDLINELSKEGIYNPSIPILKTYCENGDPEV